MQIGLLVFLGLRKLEAARLEGTGAGGDDDGLGPVHALFGGQHEGPVVMLSDVQNLFFQADRRLKLHRLLDQVVDEVLGLDLRKAGHIVDVLLGIQRRKLPAELRHAFENFDGALPHAGIERRKEPRRPTADDRDVVQPVVLPQRLAHRVFHLHKDAPFESIIPCLAGDENDNGLPFLLQFASRTGMLFLEDFVTR